MSDAKPLVLVVDDETHILHVVSMKLQNAGYEVVTAEDGEEALQIAVQRRPDLVITDYQMPFMTGVELCIKLKEHQPTRATPCIMLTARGYNIAQQYLDQANITTVLTKPFSPREVLGQVQALLRGQGSATRDQDSAPDRSPTQEISEGS